MEQMLNDQQPKRHVSRNGTKRRRGGEPQMELHRQSPEDSKPSDLEGQVVYRQDSDGCEYVSIKCNFEPNLRCIPPNKLDKGPRRFLTPSSFEGQVIYEFP